MTKLRWKIIPFLTDKHPTLRNPSFCTAKEQRTISNNSSNNQQQTGLTKKNSKITSP